MPGVAIAAALVPPLATAGLCAAQGLFALSSGAILLFVANLIAINAAGGLVFLWLGFGPSSDDKEERRVALQRQKDENRRQVQRANILLREAIREEKERKWTASDTVEQHVQEDGESKSE